MQTEKTYNGWTNYATWRVNLEIFGGLDPRDYWLGEIESNSAYDLSKQLEEYVGNIIDLDGSLEGLAVDYARAFVADVNWYEIAEHMIDDVKAEAA